MQCCNNNHKKAIILVRGNDTDFNNASFLTIRFITEILDLSTFKAVFKLGNIVKTFDDISSGEIVINFTAAETARLLTECYGTLNLIDTSNRIATIENRIPFEVISVVNGNAIATEPYTLNFDVKQGGETILNISVESAVTVEVGQTTTLPPGSEATVTNAGTPNHLILDFGIPRGYDPVWGHIEGDIMEQQDLQDELNSISGGLADSITALDDKFTSITGALDDKIDSVSGALSDSISAVDDKYNSITGGLSDDIDALDSVVSDNYNTLDDKIDSINGALSDSIDSLSSVVSDNYNTLDSLIGGVDDKIDTHIADTSNPHSVTATQVGLGNCDNTSDADKPVSTAQQTALDNKVTKNADITAATKCKITYDTKGLVTAGADLQQSDIPALNLTKISDVTSTYTEVNQLHESGAVKADFEKLHAVTADATELNILDGVTASTSEINTLNGLTASTAELNILDGATVSTAELNVLDGITANTSELNILDGATVSTTELNYVDGVTSAIQTQFDNITDVIPAAASDTNQLADKDFVNSSISTNTANFIGTFATVTALNAYAGTVTNNDYAFVVNSVVTDNGNDWATFNDLDAYNKDLLTNLDYAWVINSTKFDLYRFDIINQVWELRVSNTDKADVTLNTAYNRYKATVTNNTTTWEWEYTLNNSSFTAAQWLAINSGITSATKVTHTANTAIGDANTPVYINASGAATPLSYTIAKSVPSNAEFTDTTYSFATGTANGTISVTEEGGTAQDIAVKGLGSAAYTSSGDYATAAQGTKADSAVQSVTTGSTNGTISVDGTDVSVYGLGSAAYTASTAYATSTQGGKADSAIQSVKVNGTALTPDANKVVDVTVPTKISDLSDDTATYPIDKADTLTGLTATITELNYVDGVTSDIQTQLNSKLTTSDIVSSVSSSSTNSKAVGAKLFYDTCGDIETLINAL